MARRIRQNHGERLPRFSAAAGFSLVELLVVIGIIALLIGLLLPAWQRAQKQARMVNCRSNLRSIGQALYMYSINWKGWFYPPDLGAGNPHEDRWPVYVFDPPVWNPPILLCPSDIPEPAEMHSYLLNSHLADQDYIAGSRVPGKTSAEIVLMGEKRSDYPDYYMNVQDYETRVEPFRHGASVGSNYLYVDGHVELARPKDAQAGIDPWDPQAIVTTPVP